MPSFSLRGKLTQADNALGLPVRIFDYVSPDRTRAWKVKEAHVWPITVREDTGGDEGKIVQQFALGTDDGWSSKWDQILDPTENRTFAWALWAGFVRDSASDFISPESGYLTSPFTIDPDTIVVKELWIAMSSTTESATSPLREWGYMVILEEVKISSAQSIFQQIKGMAQNIT
tara:strand:- start:19 stop:540 length:522 start_codon:yes stop_codon:yes gene_type:complete